MKSGDRGGRIFTTPKEESFLWKHAMTKYYGAGWTGLLQMCKEAAQRGAALGAAKDAAPPEKPAGSPEVKRGNGFCPNDGGSPLSSLPDIPAEYHPTVMSLEQ